MGKVIDVSGEKIEIIKENIEENSFVYLDPPYYPMPKENGKGLSLNQMYGSSFTPNDFLILKERCDELTKNNIPFILHNSNCEFIRRLFKDYPIIEVNEKQNMKRSSKKCDGDKARCVIITNYECKDDFMKQINFMNEEF